MGIIPPTKCEKVLAKKKKKRTLKQAFKMNEEINILYHR